MTTAVDENVLTAWLCVYRLQMDDGDEITFSMPTRVRSELEARGWIDADDEITERGLMVSDLNAAEWGIDPLG